ncbi:MAG: lipocalin family protein [Acidobacteriota bacterium]
MKAKASKTIFVLFVVQSLYLFIPHAIFCQTEKLDIIEYTPPKGWTKTPKDGLTVYNNYDKTTGGFCLLTVYPSTSSTGGPDKDFINAWNERVAKPFKAEANPKTETQTDGGWTSVSAATQIQSDGNTSAVMLTVVSGYGRTASILAILNNQEYFPQIEALMAGIKMDKAKAIAYAKPPSTASASPTTPLANSYDPAALVGRWGNGIANGGSATQQYYQFNADGTYSFALSGYSGLAGRIGTFQITTEESGVYTLNGDSITITPKKSQSKSNSEGLKDIPLEVVTYRWTIHYFEGVREYALIMHPDHKTKRDGEFSYGYAAFPNSYGYTQKKK